MLLFTRAGLAMGLLPFNVALGQVLLHRHQRTLAVFWIVAVGGAALLSLLAEHLYERTCNAFDGGGVDLA